MVNQCAIHGCISKSGRRKEHISTFALPRDPELLELWIQNLPHYISTKKSARICQLHFREEDVIKFDKVIIDNEVKEYPRKNFKLKSRAVPLFFGNMSKSSPGDGGTHILRHEKINPVTINKMLQNRFESEESINPSSTYSDRRCSVEDVRNLTEKIHDFDRANNIFHLTDIAEFYQNCEDLQKNWIFLQEKNRAFLCHISLDTDVAKMDASVCIHEDLVIVLGVAQEQISEYCIPKYFKKVDTLDKLQDLMAFMERVIIKVKKSKSYNVDHKKPSMLNSTILEGDIKTEESVLNSYLKNRENKNVNYHIEQFKIGGNGSSEISSDDEYSRHISCKSEKSELSSTNTDLFNPENTNIVEGSQDSYDESIEMESFEDGQSTIYENNRVDNINDQSYENDEINRRGDIFDKAAHESELSNENKECDFENPENCEVPMENNMEVDWDQENDEREELVENKRDVDDLSGVTNTLNKWKSIKQQRNKDSYSESGGHESDMHTEQERLSESQSLEADSEYIENSKLESDPEIDETIAQNKLAMEEEHVEELAEEPDMKFEAVDGKAEENKETFSCAHCGNKFPNKNEVLNHLEQQCKGSDCSDLTLFICEICNEAFDSNLDINNHIRNFHSDTENDQTEDQTLYVVQNEPEDVKHYGKPIVLDEPIKQIYKECEFCDKEFTSKSGYVNHINNKHNQQKKASMPKMYPCPYCDKAYRSEVELDGHINGHKGEKPYTCDVCRKSYQSKISLYTHSKTHTGEQKIYQCDQCEHTFTQKVNCVAHMRLHTGEKPYTCEECGKGFTFIGLWKTHQRIHQGIMPYGCPVCFKKFHDKSSLKKHQLRKKHKGEAIIDENHIKVSMYKKKHLQHRMSQEEIES